MDLILEEHATLAAELADAGAERAAVLSRHDLDEARWEALDAAWQARLSEALDDDGEGAALLSRSAAADDAAQRALGPPTELAEVTRRLEAGGEMQASLAKVSVTLSQVVRGTAHWSRVLATEPDMEQRFDAAVRGR